MYLKKLIKKYSNRNFILRSESGFTIMEITIGAALMGIVLLGGMQLFSQVNNVKKRGENFLKRSDFNAAFTQFVGSGKGCSELIGHTIGSTFADIEISNWSYLGASSIKATDMIDGIKVVSLAARQSLASDLPTVKIAADILKKTMVEVKIVLKQKGVEKTHYYNIPVLSLASGEVKLCSSNKSVAQICNTMLGTYDATTNNCIVANSCQLRGTYKTLTCTPVPSDGSDCDLLYGLAESNIYTTVESCPTGSVPTVTGLTNWNHSVSCGKKCSQTITNTVTWFSCLECAP
jgi:hypothetical protein